MAVKIEFLRKKMVKFVESMGINYSKKYYQRDLLQFIQQNFVGINLMLIGFKLQALQADYFANQVIISQKENQQYSVQIRLHLLNFKAEQFLQIRNSIKAKQVTKICHQIKYQFGYAVAVFIQINLQAFIKKQIQQKVIY